MSDAVITIEEADPMSPPVLALIAELDRLMGELYAAEESFLVAPSELAGPGGHFFAAYREGEALGCAGLLERAGDYAEVKRLFVSPAARGRGVGRRLLDMLEAAARAREIPCLRLETGDAQPGALALFESLGYRRCGRFGDYPEDTPRSVFMEKRLDPAL
jgi:putative acetyltransferase